MLASRVSIWYGVFLAAEGHRRKKCFGACRSGVESTHVQRARGDAPKAAACDAAGACSSTRRCRDHPHGRRRSVGFARGEPRGERERRHARTPERRVGADRSLGGDSALSAAHACEGGPRVGCGTRQQPKVDFSTRLSLQRPHPRQRPPHDSYDRFIRSTVVLYRTGTVWSDP